MESHRLYLRAFTAADREIRDKKDHEKVIQIWIFLGSVLAFFTFVNVVRKLVSLAPPTPTPSRPTPSTPIDDEKVESGQQFQRTPRGRLSRAFSSFSAAWRIFFFRYTVLIGPSASALWSELGFIFVYITVNLLCTFVDSKCRVLSAGLPFHRLSSNSMEPEAGHVQDSLCDDCFLSASPRDGFGFQKQHSVLWVDVHYPK